MTAIELVLRGEHITLDAVLKTTGLAASGGAAKALIGEGRVQVDGRDELRKTCKVRAGQVVRLGDARVRIVAAASAVLGAPDAPSLPQTPEPADASKAPPPGGAPRATSALQAAERPTRS